MNNMDERLNRSNRLPGSEKLTRPEEIGQLSKYLKSIKEVYEESTRLEDQVLGVTGYSTGKIPEINSLGDKSVKAPENQGETPDLSQKILGVPGGKDRKNKLEDKRLELSDTNIVSELDDRIITSPGNKGGEVSRLEEVIKKIQDVRNQSLEEKKINLLDERNIALEDTRLDLQAIINTSLENKRIDLKDERETKLGDTKLGLTDNRQVELENTRVNISDSRDQKLEDKVIGLRKPEEVELEDKRLDIQDDRVESLENKRIDLSAEEDIELGKKRIDLKEPGEIELTDKKVRLWDEGDIELGEKRLQLYDQRDLELEDKKVKVFNDKEEIELEDKKIELEDDRIIKLRGKKIGIRTTLSDKIIGLEETGSEPSKLEDTRIDISDEREPELRNKKLEIKDENETSLSDKLLELSDERLVELEDKKLDLKDDRDQELEDKRLNLTDERNSELGDKKIELKDERETKLGDKILKISDKRESSLSDKLLSLLDERETELEDKRLDIKDDREPSLSDKILELEDEREEKLEDKVVEGLESENGEPEELYDSILVAPENVNGEPTELYDTFLGIAENKGGEVDELEDTIIESIENQGEEIDELEDKRINLEDDRETKLENKRLDLEDQRNTNLSEKILGVAENKGFAPDLSNIDSLRDYTSSLSDSELYEFAMKLANEGDNASGDHDGWMEKVSGLMSAYLSSDILTPKRAIEFRDAINNTLEMSYFGSQAALRVPVDTSSGTTWAKAEEMVSEQITGTNRRDALDEMIVKLVDYKKNNLPSLPGSDLVDATKGAIKNDVGVITGSGDHPNPMNKPLHMNGEAIPGGYGDTLYQAANNRVSLNTLTGLDTGAIVGDTVGTAFYDRYWKAKSFKTTLEELCPIVGKAPIASLTELKAILKSSPYFTSPGKFMTDTKGSYNTFSLDTNMYWEVTLEPFCSNSGNSSNGGFSFLPAIQEINVLNSKLHGVSTNYGYWAPINGFELQKSKLTTKSLSLYEGEIAYPTGMEFTNELRLTFVDDAWKSWKRYFERCAEVAVYNSRAHDSKYYDNMKSKKNIGYTQIDKTNICIASYKNLAFNIKIYIMNPQLNLINRFNLLCVLKDYSEEYVGEVDSGGTDLNVSFSIVGENPEEDATKKLNPSLEVISNLAQQALLQAQKRTTAAINSSVGLL